jgi:uncharacterized protein YfaP (DUF2135 family)
MADEVIVLTGIKETVDALKQFDKAAARKFNKVINDELNRAEKSADNLVVQFSSSINGTPMSGWRKTSATNPRTRGGAGWPAWNVNEIQAGIKKSRVQGKVRGDYTTSAGALINSSAAGAIFEVAGRNSKPKSSRTSSDQFLITLSNRFKPASRLIWSVVDRQRNEIQKRVAAALEDAKKTLQTNLNSRS